MPKPRKSISAQAASILLAGIEAQKTNLAISEEILTQTGERVATRTIGRRKAEWWSHRKINEAARERAQMIVAELKNSGLNGSDLVHAQVVQLLLDDPAQIAGDPKLVISSEKNRIARERIEIMRGRLDVDRRKMALLEGRENRATAVLDSAKQGSKDPKEALESLYAIFGRPQLERGALYPTEVIPASAKESNGA
jgi:hypothetical protein